MQQLAEGADRLGLGILQVEWIVVELRVAQGAPLPFTQAQVISRGHAIECRVCAEDPAQNFLPSIGQLLRVVEPRGVRVDSGFLTGDEISQYYDSLIAKVIVHAPDRATAIARADAALARHIILGVTTNIPFLRALLAHPEFVNGTATTRLIGDKFAEIESLTPKVLPSADWGLIASALTDALSLKTSMAAAGGGQTVSATTPWDKTDSFRLGTA